MRFMIVVGSLTALAACDEAQTLPAPASSATVATSVASTSAASSPAPSPSASAAPDEPASPSVASLKAQASARPDDFEGEPVTLDATFVRQTQKRFGTGEHPRYTFAVVELALGDSDDTLPCYFTNTSWPPPGLNAGDALTARGTWSFDRVLAGGIVPGGGPLHIKGCKLEPR